MSLQIQTVGTNYSCISPSIGHTEEGRNLISAIFPKAVYKMPSFALSDGMKGAFDAAANLTSASRSIDDFSADHIEYTQSVLHHPFTYASQGITTAGYLPVAIIAYDRAKNKQKVARSIGDKEGMLDAKFEIASRIFLGSGAFCYLFARPLSIVTTITPTSSLTLASTVFGKTGGGFFNLIAATSIVKSLISIYRGIKFEQALEKTPHKLKLHFLQKNLMATQEEVLSLLTGKFNNDAQAVAKACKNEALKKASKDLHDLIKELRSLPETKIPELSLDECKNVVLSFLQQNPNAWEQHGLDILVAKLQAKKEMQMARLLSPECIKSIREGKVDAVVKTFATLQANRSNTRYVIFLFLMSILAFIGGFLATSGTLLLLVAIAGLINNFGMMKLDTDAWLNELKAGTPSRLDKKFLIASMIANVLSFGTGLALMCAFSSFAVIPFICSLVIFAVWGYVYMKTWNEMRENDQVYLFARFLKKEKTQEKVQKYFLKMPLSAKCEIRDRLKEQREMRVIELQEKGEDPSQLSESGYTYEELVKAATTPLDPAFRKKKLAKSLAPLLHRTLASNQLQVV